MSFSRAFVALFLIVGSILAEAQQGGSPTVETSSVGTYTSSAGIASMPSPVITSLAINGPGEEPAPDQVADTLQVAVPDEISGKYSPLVGGDLASSKANLIRLGVDIGSYFDDNALDISTKKISDFQYSISPVIAIQQIGPRTAWSIDYIGGLAFDPQFGTRDIVNQKIQSGLSYQLSRHLQLSLHQSYTDTSNPFARYGQDQFLQFSQGTSVVNSWVVTPTLSSSVLEAGGALEWQAGPHTTVGLTASEAVLRFGQAAGVQSLLPTDTTNVRTYFARQLSRRHSLGLSVQAGFLETLSTPSHTRTQAFQFLYVFAPWYNVEMSIYGGPQHILAHSDVGLPVNSDHWFPSGGAAIAWRKTRYGMRLAYGREISDGGGITPAVRLQSVNGEFVVSLSRKSQIGLTLGAADNLAIYAADGLQSFRTIESAAWFNRQLLPRLWFRARYAHIHESRGGLALIDGLVDHNRVEAALSYRFARPWGR